MNLMFDKYLLRVENLQKSFRLSVLKWDIFTFIMKLSRLVGNEFSNPTIIGCMSLICSELYL
jgi:hypothetical protein